jgi:hypothetical protein
MFSSSEFDDVLARLRGVEELLKTLEDDTRSRDGGDKSFAPASPRVLLPSRCDCAASS